jgi:thymidylate synthase
MTLELNGYVYKLIANNGRFMQLEEMVRYKKDTLFWEWAKSEAYERVALSANPGHAWKIRPEFWTQFLRHDKFAYTYSERFHEQLGYVVNELSRNPETRQAIMTVYDRHQDMMNWGGLDRVPCSISYHFIIRDRKLHLIYSMRSCDFVNFFQADVWCAIVLQNRIANQINVDCGTFTHIINCLHAFKKDLGGVF